MILDAYPDLTVDLDHADIDLHVEVREQVYLYTETIQGAGGMPCGQRGQGHAAVIRVGSTAPWPGG